VTVYSRSTLASGVRVVTAPVPQVDSIACLVGLAAGTRYDTPATKGAAHFVEHMLFTGTEQRPTMPELAEEIESIGAQSNAATAREHTYYWIKATAEHRAQVVDILADMVQNSRFDPAEIEREKDVIVEEMRRTLQSPGDYVDELFEELLYSDQPLGWRLDGTEETVRASTRETLHGFARRWYSAGRMVVGVAGRVDDDVTAHLEEAFAPPADDAPGPEPVRLEGDGSHVLLETKDTTQAELALGLRAHPLGHPDRYVLQLIRTILGSGMSSRLYRELVAERGLAYSISATLAAYSDAGSLFAQGGVNADRVDEAAGVIADAFRRVATEQVPAEELEKARNYAKGGFVFQLETPLGLIRFAVRREAVEGGAVEPAEILTGLDAVTAADVQRVAAELLDGGLYLAVIGPFDDASRFERVVGARSIL
jgi:predicted Zn-dependent peptidase